MLLVTTILLLTCSITLILQANGGCDGAEQFMGEPASPNGESGNYYLTTNAQHPYAKGASC